MVEMLAKKVVQPTLGKWVVRTVSPEAPKVPTNVKVMPGGKENTVRKMKQPMLSWKSREPEEKFVPSVSEAGKTDDLEAEAKA